MSELLKELCRMADFISDLFRKEKNPGTKKGILELLIMISDKIRSISKYKDHKIQDDFLTLVIDHIKETEKLINDYKQNDKTYADLLEHVVDIVNEVEALIFKMESPDTKNESCAMQSNFFV